jgi:hypothetical protein
MFSDKRKNIQILILISLCCFSLVMLIWSDSDLMGEDIKNKVKMILPSKNNINSKSSCLEENKGISSVLTGRGGNSRSFPVPPTNQDIADVPENEHFQTIFNQSLAVLKVQFKFNNDSLGVVAGGLPVGTQLLPSQRQHIILVSQWRSGSTFMANILSQIPGTLYHHEPLHNDPPYRLITVLKLLFRMFGSIHKNKKRMLLFEKQGGVNIYMGQNS